jgi:hypothetical protein
LFDDVAVPDGGDAPRRIMQLDILGERCVEAANGEDARTRPGPDIYVSEALSPAELKNRQAAARSLR